MIWLALMWVAVLMIQAPYTARHWSQHAALIMWVTAALVLLQLYMVGDMLRRRWLQAVELNEMVREANDAMELAIREEGDVLPLSRVARLSTKPTKDMTADELVEYMSTLHGNQHHGQ